MKLLKALAACIVGLVLMVSVTACNATFCSTKETEQITQEIRIMLDEETGLGEFATPADWDTQTEAQKEEYINKILKSGAKVACLTFEEDTINIEKTDGTAVIPVEVKTWGEAFSYGFFDGLLSYPFGFLMDKLARGFGLNGWGQFFSIIIVTFIIRLAVVLLTWKPTMAQQRMTLLQPEMAKIQAKYGNTQDPVLKQKQAQETMALYKKNKINPISSLIMPFITLPIFIGVYGAVRACLVLKEDVILGLDLSQKLSTGVLSFNILAIVIFIVMIGLQYLTMKLPELLNKDKYSKLDAKEKKAGNQTKTFTYVMLIMVVVVGWMLPISMSVYWLASSGFSCLQTLITTQLMRKQQEKERIEKRHSW